ncbi:hypothetical protein [Luteolibacter soli]|uniref:Uncharacterized protein n=1 Tax=Luteolibacter soli TaxID=3135280 RepID=A0ABU9APD1_9BACT
MKRFLLTILATAGIVCAVCWHFRDSLPAAWRKVAEPMVTKPTPDAARYAELKEEAQRRRRDLSAKYAKARTKEEKDRVMAETRGYLETLLPAMMRCWLGTTWDFHGTADTPGQGKIACGYFVATVLRDAGFEVDRYKLAQQASQNIIRTFLPSEAMTLRVGVPYENFASEVAGAEPGIRIVGLDSHVAFLVTGPDGFHFIHSSGCKPWCVVDEGRDDAEALRRSNYRVHGLLTSDRTVLLRWLKAEKIAVKETSTATASAKRR